MTLLFQRPKPASFIILILLLLNGCAAMVQKVHLPPVAATLSGQIQDGRFVWLDLITEDTVAAASFYSRLFGWRAARSAENEAYYLFTLDGKPVAGMAATESKDAAAPESLWLATVSVSDVAQRAAAVKVQGGKVLEGPVDVVGRGPMVLVSDPAGAPFILLGTGGSAPMGSKARIGQWLWTDLVTRDQARAGNFYTALLGYQVKTVEAGEDHHYRVFKRNGRAVAGMVALPWEGLEDNWLPYFRVADLDDSIASARNLGGSLVLKRGDVAVLADPTGAVFGIQAR